MNGLNKFVQKAEELLARQLRKMSVYVLICFVALMVGKYMELTTQLSLSEIRFLVWEITETHI